MASASKKPKISPLKYKTDEEINFIASAAAEVEFPWEKVSPLYFTDWLDLFSRAHGTSKELMLMSILPSVSALLGLSKLKATSTYHENLSLFTLCISPPSGGKNQCFSFGCKGPIGSIEKQEDCCILLDKFTEVGLRQHLLQNQGVALIINEEMEDTMRQIHCDREGSTLCRLFDGDSIYINSGNSSSRVAINKTSVSLGGFMQVRQFFKEIYPSMIAAQNGFDLRFLFAIITPEALTRKQTEPYAERLATSLMPNLHEFYKAIHKEHLGGDVVYTLSDGALALFDAFDEEVCMKLNEKWRSGKLLDNSHSESGKERRLVLRLSAILHVIYSYSRRQLFHCFGMVPRVISETSMKYAIALIKYFTQQRKEIDKILTNSGDQLPDDNISNKILSHPGPVVTVSFFRSAQSSRLRKEWSPAIIKNAMEKLTDKDLGEVVAVERTIAFVKCPLQYATDEKLQEFGISKEVFQQALRANDLNLSTAKLQELLGKCKKYNNTTTS